MSRADGSPAPALEAYLSRLDTALAALPDAERREILLETRSHAIERTHRTSRDVAAVLSELGPPEAYARRFLAERDAGPAPPPPPRPDSLRAIARLATGGWTRLPLLFVVVLAYGAAAGLVIVAVWKFFEPDAVGLWGGQVGVRNRWAVGVSDPNMPGRELLGYWIVPVALVIAAAIHLVMSALLRRLLRRDASRP